MAKGETSAGWHDLEAAEKLGADAAVIGSLKRQLIEQALAEAEQLLAAGSCEACLAVIEKLERRGGAGQDTRQLKQVVRKFDEARKLVRRGKFAEAQDALAVASSLRPDLKCIEQAARECQEKRQQCSLLQEALHKELADENWPDVLHTADQMLAAGPGLARGAGCPAEGLGPGGDARDGRSAPGSRRRKRAHRVPLPARRGCSAGGNAHAAPASCCGSMAWADTWSAKGMKW